MSVALRALIYLTLVLAVGCTRKPDAPAEVRDHRPLTPSQANPAKQDLRPVIVVLGDSLAEGFGVEPGQSYPDRVQQMLDSKGYGYRIVNMGISGDTTTGGLGRLQAALDLKPEIVVLELGGNDGLRGVPITSTRKNLEQMITASKEAGARVLLAGMRLPPNYGSDYIEKFAAVYKDLSAKHKVELIPFLFEDIVSGLAKNPRLMQRDGIHPSAEGHQVMANTVWRYLEPMLKRS
jgi:acyl-CoA thioesterase-1